MRLICFCLGLITSVALATPTPIDWPALTGLNTDTGEISTGVTQLIQTPIKIAGFIVPIELGDDIATVDEFILVSNPLACLHMPPPPPNQMIYVKMNTPIPLDMDARGVWITGTLSIPRAQVEYGYYGYELAGTDASRAQIDVDALLPPILAPH